MSTPKLKKIDREFCITDDSVNVYGYRCLTSGMLMDEVKKNPIGFKMHNRDNGIVVRWEDFRIDGDKVYAKPVINLAHPEGENIVSEIENGFLNAASVGRIVCLDASDEKSLMLPGQTGLTITEWFPREISLVDIPGNYNALANLYDIDDNELNLSDFVKPKPNEMSKILLTAAMLTALNLSDKYSDDDATKAFQDLVDLAKKVPGLEKDLADKTTALTNKEKELDDLKADNVAKEVQDLLAKGEADKKLTKEVSAKLGESYKTDPKGLKDLIDAMPAQTLITDQLGDNKDMAEFIGKSWDDLYQSNKLETVRTQFPDLYEKLKKEKYPNA
ncbi:phage protease [Flavobacterium gilvum]|uniref:Mu-like prophage I protein n=1 Tax=Flavobacterium gilvum TaxID=1492737 RepID=A0AAC9I7R8_9FLAO|nr:phage protease [Flavobacterium gilvum]AOW09512.1 hypothetical protein EM308_08370 [Flavobacterium gilvum]KFC60018.1 hypothetical protein FEM08_11970 [Flavobacterium gilvum]